MKMYHGTTHKIEEFNLDFVGEGNDQLGLGIYLTNDMSNAYTYSEGKYIYELEVDTSNISSFMDFLDYETVEKLIIKGYEFNEDSLGNFGEIAREGYNNVLDKAVRLYLDIGGFNALMSIQNDFYNGNESEFPKAYYDITGISGFTQMFPNNLHDNKKLQHLVIYNPAIIKIKEEIDLSLIQDIQPIISKSIEFLDSNMIEQTIELER